MRPARRGTPGASRLPVGRAFLPDQAARPILSPLPVGQEWPTRFGADPTTGVMAARGRTYLAHQRAMLLSAAADNHFNACD